MSLAAAVSSGVSAAIRDRGREYFRSGAVRLDSVGPTAVAATVEGSDTYDVSLSVQGRTVVASCTCPYVDDYGAVCKHIWATVLAADARGFARAAASGRLTLVLEDADDPDDDYDPPYPRPVPPPRPAPARETWANQLDALGRQLQPAAGTTAQPAWPTGSCCT